jgi:hypothetical protein
MGQPALSFEWIYGIFGINVDFSRSVQSGFFLRKKPLEARAFGLQ